MKFRTPTFQASRDPNDEGFKPMPFKMPTMPVLREKKSRSASVNGEDGAEMGPPARRGTGFSRKKSTPNLNKGNANADEVPPVPALFSLKKKMSMPNMSNGTDDGKDAANSPAMKQALRDLLQKTGTNLRDRKAKSDNKAPPKKSKEARPVTKRSSRSFDIGDDVLERAVKASKDEKRTPKASDRRQSTRIASARPPLSSLVQPVESQEDIAKKLLTVDQVRAMCMGAPCFSVEESDGRYKPQVMFRGSNAETSAEFPADFKHFGHPSFAACTLYTDTSIEDFEAVPSDSEETKTAKPTIDLTEVPSMLSADGLDAGAVGFEHFLQLPIADDLVRLDDSDPSYKRRLLKSSPMELGLRQPNIEILIARLTELEQLLKPTEKNGVEFSIEWNETKIEEVGVELFGKLLSSEMGTTSAGTGSVSMKTQIKALQKVLRTSGLWYDFALVEWRTKIGHLLWEVANVGNKSTDEGEIDERDILLLQITLAAELLLRITAVRSMEDAGTPMISQKDMDKLNGLRTTKVEWDLLLAERFLLNIHVSTKTSNELVQKNKRTSLFYAIPFLSSNEAPEFDMQYLQPQLHPKHGEQQLGGLLHFAEALQWPHAQALPKYLDGSLDMGEKFVCLDESMSTYLTPTTSPDIPAASVSWSSSDGLDLEPNKPALSKTTTAESVQLVPAVRSSQSSFASFEGCGWLSRSWLSGLVMPGEAGSHFLMSTLLEHSPKAISRLGNKANLYGGFVYDHRSYWSKSCVVGRVLAAKKGAKECMEWISVPELGEAQQDAWIDLAVKEMPESKVRPRILNAEVVAKDSDLLHNKGLMHTARVGDFKWPTDGPLTTGSELVCQGLSFNNTAKIPGSDDEGSETKRSIATLTFGSIIKRQLSVVEMPLTYDACFVSSYPCHPKTATTRAWPSPAARPQKLAFPPAEGKENADPSKEQIRPKTAPSPVDSAYGSKQTSTSGLSFSDLVDKDQSLSTPMHPLHVDYRYDVVPVSTLFTSAMETRPRAMSFGAERPPEFQAAAKEVMVLDCRGAEDLELFARAWCAKVGENAVIGKSGRTCLACCIREARALGICVVIRT